MLQPGSLHRVEIDPGECHRHRLFLALEQLGLRGFEVRRYRRFTKAGQLDWAVLCSRERMSGILVFRAGRDDVAELGAVEDRSFLQNVGGGSIGFSRLLGVARSDFIREMNEQFGNAKLPPLDHDGINDIFADKASSVWYWFAGKWLRLAGAD